METLVIFNRCMYIYTYLTNNFVDRNANGPTFEPTKPILPKNPRYIDTRVDELFPSRKNNLRNKVLSGKENVKVCIIKYPLDNFWFD